MSEPHRGNYPLDWIEISDRLKKRVGWQCERCRKRHDPSIGYTLTVHHLDNDKSNCEAWNLVALCQRCHLHVQGRVDLRQGWIFELPPWLRWRYKARLEWFGKGAKDKG